MWKTSMALGSLALVAGLSTGCSSDDAAAAESTYCTDFKADHAKFQALAGEDISALGDVSKDIHHLASEAPDEIADEWKVVDDGFTALSDALEEAGITFDDLARMEKGAIPDGVDLDKLEALGPKLESFAGPEMEKAALAIEAHAKKECGVVFTDS
jgi:hypothetical protein